MPVYVDDLFFHPRTQRRWCHMMADTDDELEAMARAIGLKPHWRDKDHYDLSPDGRARAVSLGAVEVKATYMVELRKRRRGDTSS